MSEQTMRKRVVKALKPLDAMAVENPAKPGTPDVNYVEGWLELKWLRDWPIRKQTVVKIDHFTAQQRVWLVDRHRRGGTCHVLLQCHQEWFLLNPLWAAEHLGRVDRQQIVINAIFYKKFGLDDKDFCQQLSWLAGQKKTEKER